MGLFLLGSWLLVCGVGGCGGGWSLVGFLFGVACFCLGFPGVGFFGWFFFLVLGLGVCFVGIVVGCVVAFCGWVDWGCFFGLGLVLGVGLVLMGFGFCCGAMFVVIFVVVVLWGVVAWCLGGGVCCFVFGC